MSRSATTGKSAPVNTAPLEGDGAARASDVGVAVSTVKVNSGDDAAALPLESETVAVTSLAPSLTPIATTASSASPTWDNVPVAELPPLLTVTV